MDPAATKAGKSSRLDLCKSFRRTRKRATRACLLCRARKVRCDVSQRGSPCTNCCLDNVHCLVSKKTSNSRRTQDALTPRPHSTLPIDEVISDTEAADKPAELLFVDPKDYSVGKKPVLTARETIELELADAGYQGTSQNATKDPPPEWSRDLFRGSSDDHSLNASRKILQPYNPWAFLRPQTIVDRQQPTTTDVPMSSEISYSSYPFLTITNIHQIPLEDFSFLELKGCLKVPIRPVLDEFVRQYFLHVHPILPLINEGDFWDLYDNDGRQSRKEPIALLLFQAMLFAASTFVSKSTARALGYSTLRTMRGTLLRRAKRLYDLESELSPLVLAQSSVLLSTASLSSSGKINTIWLNLAIENSKLAEAHLYTTMTLASPSKRRNILKRLWWCCIIRDRSIGLLLKRPVQITKEQFNLSYDPLNSDDLEDELQRSKVYCPSSKLKLAEILSQSVLLFTRLTDVLMLIYPPNGIQLLTQQEHDGTLLQLYDCKSSLREWYLGASSNFRIYQKQTDLGALPKKDQTRRHDSITLYTNLMYMYYHTARIGLCHHEVLCLDIGDADGTLSLSKDQSGIFETRHELQGAITDVTECHEELLRQDLVQWMPHSAMGFSTLPLILNLLDKKLSGPVKEGIHPPSTATQYQLNILIEFIRVYWARYEGVDWITAIVRHIFNLAQLNGSGSQRRDSSINWLDIFAMQPRSYLRLILVLDLSLRKGRLVQDADFPVKLRGSFSLDLNSLKELVERRYPCFENRKSPLLWPTQSSSLESALRDQLQLYNLGLDDCLINILENEIDFQPSTDTSTSLHQEWEETGAKWSLLSQSIASLSSNPANGPESSGPLSTNMEETFEFKDSTNLEDQAKSALELEDIADEDHFINALFSNDIVDNVSYGVIHSPISD